MEKKFQRTTQQASLLGSCWSIPTRSKLTPANFSKQTQISVRGVLGYANVKCECLRLYTANNRGQCAKGSDVRIVTCSSDRTVLNGNPVPRRERERRGYSSRDLKRPSLTCDDYVRAKPLDAMPTTKLLPDWVLWQ